MVGWTLGGLGGGVSGRGRLTLVFAGSVPLTVAEEGPGTGSAGSSPAAGVLPGAAAASFDGDLGGRPVMSSSKATDSPAVVILSINF